MSVKVIVRSVALPQAHLAWERAWMGVQNSLREALELSAEFFRPAAAMAFLLALWRLSSDLGWTSSFLFEGGMLYHWQVWAVIGFSLLGAREWISRRTEDAQ